MKRLGKIDYSSTPYKYYDMFGNEIKENDTIIYYTFDEDGKPVKTNRSERVYLLDDDCSLGTDATNPNWIKSGRAVPCEYGCYPLELSDLNSCIVDEAQI